MLASDQDSNKVTTIAGNCDEGNGNGPADFNKAISTTGYGLFNVLLLLGALPIAWTAVFDTTSGAFILASAECDLQLTLFRKGVLVAFPYIGMIMTACIWNYITPYISMKTLFILTLLCDSILNIVSTGVQSYYVFLLMKFMSGILAGGPLTMVMTYLTEFHSTKYKPRFVMCTGFLFSVANIVPAALGFTILPLDWHINIFGQHYNTWRIYLLICSIPSVIGLITSIILPNSPKYLMETGRSDAALKLFRRMYCMNTKQPPETFPIKTLVSRKERSVRPVLKVSLERLRISIYNMKLLLSTDYLPAFCFVSFLQFGSMLGFNTMRLWVPHLFIILNNFDCASEESQPNMCEMLNCHTILPIRQCLNNSGFEDTYFEYTCFKWVINPVIYQNSTIIASSAVIFSFLFGFVMNTKTRKRIIVATAFLMAAISSFGINWSQAPPYMLTLAAMIIVTTRIAGNVITLVNVDVIPVPLRAMSISILTMVGNIGAIVGNFIFSALLGTECVIAFIGLGCLFSVCFCLSLFFPQPVRDKRLTQQVSAT